MKKQDLAKELGQMICHILLGQSSSPQVLKSRGVTPEALDGMLQKEIKTFYAEAGRILQNLHEGRQKWLDSAALVPESALESDEPFYLGMACGNFVFEAASIQLAVHHPLLSLLGDAGLKATLLRSFVDMADVHTNALRMLLGQIAQFQFIIDYFQKHEQEILDAASNFYRQAFASGDAKSGVDDAGGKRAERDGGNGVQPLSPFGYRPDPELLQ